MIMSPRPYLAWPAAALRIVLRVCEALGVMPGLCTDILYELWLRTLEEDDGVQAWPCLLGEELFA